MANEANIEKNCNSFNLTLFHSIRAIRAHKSKGEQRNLGEYIESDLEYNSKTLQLLRSAKCHMCNQLDNFTDCINLLRMWSNIYIKIAVPSKGTFERKDSQHSKQNVEVPFHFHHLLNIILKNL